MISYKQRFVVSVASLSLILVHVFPAHSQDKRRISISIGKPAVWTLAQAHYLLANMHQQDRKLKTAEPGDLDPNAINRNTIEVLRTTFGATAEFDAVAGAKNSLLAQRLQSNLERQQVVKAQLDQRRNQQAQVAREISALQSEITALQSAATPNQTAIKAKQDEKAAKDAEKAVIDAQITTLNSEVTALSSETFNAPGFVNPAGFSQPSAPPAAPAPWLTNDKLLDKVAEKLSQSPKLHASTILDNYIQMQYEIIAKQLTLLRDEVGSDERLIFLELPCSIYSIPGKADKQLVQIRWKVESYGCKTDCDPPTHRGAAADNADESLYTTKDVSLKDSESSHYLQNLSLKVVEQKPPDNSIREWRAIDKSQSQVRAVDLVPRQSALNVAKTHDTQKGFALAAKLTTLFGFGAQVDYQRQKEIYDQFIFQDTFASGFGKGENEFGWTFGPLPGTNSIAPGARSTYAVVIVPQRAKKLKLIANGYAYDRTELQPDSNAPPTTGPLTFYVDIPSNEVNGFWLDRVDYTTVVSGTRATAVLRADYFSPQVGILVNGVPLKRSVAIAPLDDLVQQHPGNNDARFVEGSYELVNSQKIVMSFSMGRDYEGTPIITLVTPEKALSINRLNLKINNENRTCNGSTDRCDSLEMRSLLEPMFVAPLRLDQLQIINTETIPGTSKLKVKARLIGNGFRPNATVIINDSVGSQQVVGEPPPGDEQQFRYSQDSTHQYTLLEMIAPTEPIWNITVRQVTKQGFEEANLKVVRPLTPRLNYEVLSYKPPTKNPSKPGYLAVRLEVAEFGDPIRVLPVNPHEVSNLAQSRLNAGEWLVTLQPHADPVLLQITGSRGISTIVSILAPLPPTISGIINEATKKAEGLTEGNYPVLIRGDNLENVDRVFFGAKPAQILQVSPGAITVVAPKGEEGGVRVTLETNIIFKGRRVTNVGDFGEDGKATFTYVAPKPKPQGNTAAG
ncbi:MAG TPA: IPT/TIG domain-containing protein [Blastocatellia bacterium]|jgi:hypothetical protein|nr:IPT/TIG domain-containing protein [Blastocatellia bacterium]